MEKIEAGDELSVTGDGRLIIKRIDPARPISIVREAECDVIVDGEIKTIILSAAGFCTSE